MIINGVGQKKRFFCVNILTNERKMILMQGATLDGVIYFAAARLMVFFLESFKLIYASFMVSISPFSSVFTIA